jgi:hypothetical protein
MTYPVNVIVRPVSGTRNRLTTAFRPFLAIPHTLLVGPIYWSWRTGGMGLLGAAAYLMSIYTWVLLLCGREQPQGMRDFALYYLRWRTRALAYMALFVDRYPSFGDDEYPAALEVQPLTAVHDRRDVGLRLLLAIPHIVVLAFILTAWLVTTVIAWFAILLTSTYPRGLMEFGIGVMQWALRVEAYLLFLTDAYPPFEIAGITDRPVTTPTPASDVLILPATDIAR